MGLRAEKLAELETLLRSRLRGVKGVSSSGRAT